MHEMPTIICNSASGGADATCPVCESHSGLNGHLHYVSAEWELNTCQCCGHVFLAHPPSYEDVATKFAWEKTSASETQRRQSTVVGSIAAMTRWRTYLGHVIDNQRRRRTLGANGNVLDIGCGGSCRIPVGAIPYGIEISAVLAEASRLEFEARGGAVIHAPALAGLDKFSDGFFDAILMRSYLEHEKHPFEVLTKACHKLRSGGKIYVRVPNYGSVNRRIMGSRWCGYRFPDHVNYFTPRTLKRVANRAALMFRHVNRFNPLDDNIIAELIRP